MVRALGAEITSVTGFHSVTPRILAHRLLAVD
jgi:hypothetical protein